MYPNPVDCDAAAARYHDLLREAEQGRTRLALRATSPAESPFGAGRQRLGELLIRVGRRLEGPEAETRVAPTGAATRV